LSPVMNGATADPLISPFGQMRTLVEQMVKDAREEGHKAGLVAGRVEGLQRANTLLGIAAGKLSLEDRAKLVDAFESLAHELTK
jgi:hypothetical protein